MSIVISSDFDSGNAELVEIAGNRIDVNIRKDIRSDFFQWFHFRAEGLSVGEEYTFRILNAGKSSYPEGWKIHNIPYSEDGKTWERLPSSFEDPILTFKLVPKIGAASFAYFGPYDLTRHKEMISRAQASPYFVSIEVGKSCESRNIELLSFGSGGGEKKNLWILARQHPGESMAEWFMEGLIERLCDPEDEAAKGILSWADLHLIPNINPDGTFHGNLRTNAKGANLNREWDKASEEYSPEVLFALKEMDRIGVDACLDIHGDEDIPYVFGSGAEGNPGFTERLQTIDDAFRQNWMKINQTFQVEHGYDKDEPGKGDLSLCTNQVSERFNCFSLTIEMPFTDDHNHPDPLNGWSPEKSKVLGASSIEALSSIKHLL